MQSALPQPHHAGGTGLNGKCWWVILLVQRLWSHQPSSKGGILLIKRIASQCLSEIPVAMGLLCFLQTINVPLAYFFSWNHGIASDSTHAISQQSNFSLGRINQNCPPLKEQSQKLYHARTGAVQTEPHGL